MLRGLLGQALKGYRGEPIDWEAELECHEIEGGSFEERKNTGEIEPA